MSFQRRVVESGNILASIQPRNILLAWYQINRQSVRVFRLWSSPNQPEQCIEFFQFYGVILKLTLATIAIDYEIMAIRAIPCPCGNLGRCDSVQQRHSHNGDKEISHESAQIGRAHV